MAGVSSAYRVNEDVVEHVRLLALRLAQVIEEGPRGGAVGGDPEWVSEMVSLIDRVHRCRLELVRWGAREAVR